MLVLGAQVELYWEAAGDMVSFWRIHCRQNLGGPDAGQAAHHPAYFSWPADSMLRASQAEAQ
jgi:hypothetical protein